MVKKAANKKTGEKNKMPHTMPEDLKTVLEADKKAKEAWETLTPLAQNEFICWTISVKTPETRANHVERVRKEVKEGKRRPCCWIGCIHRADKAMSSTQKYILGKKE